MFDSPCKSPHDIAFALKSGVCINADNFDELEIIADYVRSVLQRDYPEATPCTAGDIPMVGIRINPLIGLGSNEYLSVSMKTSKFGVPLTSANRARIIELFREYSWLKALHCHVGSQGCGLEMLSKGAQIICSLADEIDAAVGYEQVTTLNIGGGLPANYVDDQVCPTYEEYATTLTQNVPALLQGNRTILTEFGRSLCAKTSWTVSQVEYVKEATPDLRIGIIHAGSDLFLRTCYVPSLFPRRLQVFSSNGTPSSAPIQRHNIAGPLCFGGDLVGREVELPAVERGDFVVIRDTGSNTLSLFSRHCSRPAFVNR